MKWLYQSGYENKENARTLPKMLKGTVLYRLPLQDTIIRLSGNLKLYNKGDEGFIITPFSNDEERYIILAEAEETIPLHKFKPGSDPEMHTADWENRHFSTQSEYTGYVKSAISAIENGRLEKVVLSRCEQIELPESFEAESFFRDLSISYPDAFTYMLNIPVYGTWIGASPETLLTSEGNTIHTMALAGTKRNNNESAEQFTEKEFNEQLLVRDYVRDVLDKYCDAISVVQGVRQAGNLEHIVTYFKAESRKEISPVTIAFDLHPTPAVCGLPLREAFDFISKNEQYSRKLYAGFLGRIKKNSSDLYVNLRCMEVNGTHAVLYAGGGIVKGSDPANEWKETQNKMDTLKRVLGNREN